jgi:ATP/maltotriose-dependent transcriptional regulator MalT
LEHYQKYIYLRDSINGDDTKRNIAALESIYENEKKDNEIKQYQFQVSLQKKQSIIQWTIILSLLIVVSFLFALYVLKRRNNKLIIDQMRNDIQEYIERIEEYKNKPDEVDEKDVFYKNVEKYGLSERELEVLLLISKGLKNDEVAEKLFLSVSTVKTHTRNIFVKLDVRNRIEASRKAQNI